jgi:hypothetical protein
MPGVYLCNVIGDGLTMESAWRPDVPVGTRYACLMIDTSVKMKAIIASPSATVTGTGITLLLSGSTWETLYANGNQTSPNNPQRNNVNTWLTTNGYQTISAGMTWTQVVHFIARQVNPAADLSQTFAA